MPVSQLSASDVEELRALLLSDDRGGFYLRYYELTGVEQALIQAQISTYSGFFGGAALIGNAIAKASNPALYDLSLDDFSREIAQALFDEIETRAFSG